MPPRKFPANFKLIQDAARTAIQPLQPGQLNSYFWGKRTDAGRSLPPYYLVYFLLVELLEFPNVGQAEKVAWSVPVRFEGDNYVIEHRKKWALACLPMIHQMGSGRQQK